MTHDELEAAVRALARAVLELSKRGATAWDYDGETVVAEGIDLLDTGEDVKRLADRETTR